MSSYLPVDLTFYNASPKIESLRFLSTHPDCWPRLSGNMYQIKAHNLAEAERMISYGLCYAQSVRLVIWLGYRPAVRITGGGFRGGYRTAFTSRKYWKNNISEILPPDVYE